MANKYNNYDFVVENDSNLEDKLIKILKEV